jgi:hypothetical protein
MLSYVADQIGAVPESFTLYARREETRRDHTARLIVYLNTRSAMAQDRRAALLAAIHAGTTSDDGAAIVNSIVAAFRERGALLLAIDMIERIGLAGRTIARLWAETTLIKDVQHDTLRSLDRLLEVAPSIGQTRFHWLRSAPEAPGASNLVGLTERIAFLRRLEIDTTLQARTAAGRWDKMIRKGSRSRCFPSSRRSKAHASTSKVLVDRNRKRQTWKAPAQFRRPGSGYNPSWASNSDVAAHRKRPENDDSDQGSAEARRRQRRLAHRTLSYRISLGRYRIVRRSLALFLDMARCFLSPIV